MFKSFFEMLFKTHASWPLQYREIDEEIARAKSVLNAAREIAGKSEDILMPEGFPLVAKRDGHKSAWSGNAAVILAEENLLELKKLKAKGATSVEIKRMRN